jgi:tyrosyl-tRNA synthetase
MFGKLMSVSDHLVGKYLRLTTALDPSDVEALEREAAAGGPGAAQAKRRLAREVSALYHGGEAAEAAERRFDQIHVERELPEDIPSYVIPADLVSDGKVQLPALLTKAGLTASTSEARRKISEGAVRLDGIPVAGSELPLAQLSGRVIQVGRRAFRRLEATQRP